MDLEISNLQSISDEVEVLNQILENSE